MIQHNLTDRISEMLIYIGQEWGWESLSTVMDAYMMSYAAHKGQKRRNGDDYVYHPIRTALRLKTADPDIIAATLLHDVLEDTDYSVDDLASLFNKKIVTMVAGCTKSDTTSMIDALQMAMEKYPETLLIKAADRLDNLNDGIEKMPKKVIKRYYRENHLLNGLYYGYFNVNSDFFLLNDIMTELQEWTQRLSNILENNY